MAKDYFIKISSSLLSINQLKFAYFLCFYYQAKIKIHSIYLMIYYYYNYYNFYYIDLLLYISLISFHNNYSHNYYHY